MLRTLLIILFALTILAGTALADMPHFGMGMIVGEPTGLSGKLWMGRNTAFDGGVAWSFSGENSLHLHADYLFHNTSLFSPRSGVLGLYFGLGGRVKFDSDDSAGIRVPVGLAYMLENAPMDLFFEVVPIMDVLPDTEFDMQGALGVRYFFGAPNY